MAGIFRVAGDANTPTTFGQPQRAHSRQLDAMATDDENAQAPGACGGSTLKRKSFAMSESPPALPPPTQGGGRRAVTFAPAAPGAPAGGGGEEVFRQTSSRNRSDNAHEKQQQVPTQVSCVNVGETLRVPLSGKSVPFRVVKRRGRGFSSVVFECEREKEEDGGPPLVTVKVWSIHASIQSIHKCLGFQRFVGGADSLTADANTCCKVSMFY